MAAKDTPSMAKNKIRRSLLAIIDPHPTPAEIDLLWKYFQSSCAYCGVEIHRGSRTGHIDHVVSSALGGSNCIYNHVLSCVRCNGDEKREESWETFLIKKAVGHAVAAERHAKIAAWLVQSPPSPVTPDLRVRADAIIAGALASFDSAVRELRGVRNRCV